MPVDMAGSSSKATDKSDEIAKDMAHVARLAKNPSGRNKAKKAAKKKAHDNNKDVLLREFMENSRANHKRMAEGDVHANEHRKKVREALDTYAQVEKMKALFHMYQVTGDQAGMEKIKSDLQKALMGDDHCTGGCYGC